jgi:hypothetical protein
MRSSASVDKWEGKAISARKLTSRSAPARNPTIHRAKKEEGRRSRSHAELTRSRSPKDPFVQLFQGLSQPFMLRRQGFQVLDLSSRTVTSDHQLMFIIGR